MQRCREIQAGTSRHVAHQCHIKARLRGTARYRSLRQLCETDRLITESRQDFLVPQQTTAVRLEHQYRFANTAKGHAGQMLNGYRFTTRYRRKPNVETRPGANSAPYLPNSLMFPNDLTNRCKPQTIAVGARREKRFEDPLQRGLVHATSGIRNGNDHKATQADLIMPNPQRVCYFPHLNLDLDDTGFVHRLCRVVAKIEDDLLQLRELRRYNRDLRRLTHRELHMGG